MNLLTGVSETALMTLNGRADQADGPNAIIDDPMAITLRNSLATEFGVDYSKFGRRGQEMALRSLIHLAEPDRDLEKAEKVWLVVRVSSPSATTASPSRSITRHGTRRVSP